MTQHTPEKLVSCPVCGRGNFTVAGLRQHRCKGAPKQALAVVENKPIDLDKLDAGQIRNCCEFDPDELGRRARMMLEHVEALKKERAVKAILTGIYLCQIKAALGYGEFEKWANLHFGHNVRSGRRYMALAARFSRSSKLLLPEVVAANQLSLDLKAKGSTGAAFMAKLDKFVGNLGLTELMHRHGVITQGGSRADTAQPPSSADSAEESPEEMAAKEEAQVYERCYQSVDAARKTLLDEYVMEAMSVEYAQRIENNLKQLLAEFHAIIVKAKDERE